MRARRLACSSRPVACGAAGGAGAGCETAGRVGAGPVSGGLGRRRRGRRLQSLRLRSAGSPPSPRFSWRVKPKRSRIGARAPRELGRLQVGVGSEALRRQSPGAAPRGPDQHHRDLPQLLVALQQLADLGADHPGQVRVEHRQPRQQALDLQHGLDAVVDGGHPQPPALQLVGHALGDAVLGVGDHEIGPLRRGPLPCPLRAHPSRQGSDPAGCGARRRPGAPRRRALRSDRPGTRNGNGCSADAPAPPGSLAGSMR